MMGHRIFYDGCTRFLGGGWTWLIVIGLIAATVAITYLATRSRKGNSTNSALNILQTQYAKGEITEEEYKQRKNILTEK